jgi:hypothetical protein
MRRTYFQNEGYVAMKLKGRMPVLTPAKSVCDQLENNQVFNKSVHKPAKAFPGI